MTRPRKQRNAWNLSLNENEDEANREWMVVCEWFASPSQVAYNAPRNRERSDMFFYFVFLYISINLVSMVKKKVKVNVCAHDEWTGLLSGFCLKINVPWSWPKSSVCLSVVICFSMGIDDAIPITNKVNQNIATISFDLEQYILERDASTSENLHSDSSVSCLCVCLSLYQFDLHQSLSNLTDSHLHINHCKRFVSFR